MTLPLLNANVRPGSFRTRSASKNVAKFIQFAACSVLLALLSQHQEGDQKASDEAYKAMIKRTPSSSKKFDPWESLRAAPGK